MSMRQYYQIYCETENTLVYTWSTTIPTTCPNNPAHTIGTVVCINQNNNNSLFDAVVSLDVNNGNYTSIAEAFQDGFINVFVENGTYIESSNIVLPDRGRIVGESPGGVVIILTGGASLVSDGSNGISQTVGTINKTNNSKTITGNGTSFTSLNVNDFILVGNNYMQIASIANDTSLQLLNKYRGNTRSNEPYIAQAMKSGVTITNLTISGSSTVGLYLRALRFSTIKSIALVQSAKNLQIINCGDIGIEGFMSLNCIVGPSVSIENSVDVFIVYCNILNNNGNGVEISNNSDNVSFVSGAISSSSSHGVIIKDTSKNISIIDANIRQNNLSAIYIESTSSNNIVNGCTLIKNGTGLTFQGSDNVVSACNIYDNNVGAIIYDDNTIKGTVIESSNVNALEVFGNNCIIDGVRVKNNTGIGIHVTGSDNILTSNRVYGSVGTGVEIVNTSNDNIVTSNNFKGNYGTNYIDNGINTQNSTNLSA